MQNVEAAKSDKDGKTAKKTTNDVVNEKNRFFAQKHVKIDDPGGTLGGPRTAPASIYIYNYIMVK